MPLNRSECVFDPCDGIDCSVDRLKVDDHTLAIKSLYIGHSRPDAAACERHFGLLTADEWLLKITKKYVLMRVEEALAMIREREEKLLSAADGAIEDRKCVYRIEFEYSFVNRVSGEKMAMAEAPDHLLKLAKEAEQAPQKMSAEIAAVLDPQILQLNHIPPACLPPNQFKEMRCQVCGRDANLWLNLSDGFIGCGRKQYGVPGEISGCSEDREGAAILHWEQCRDQSLGLKLGTLTDDFCEVYNYAFDVFVSLPRPLINEALKQFGVPVNSEKTELTMDEMAVEANNMLNLTGDENLFQDRLNSEGAGVGIVNIGNSCYISSIVHCLKHVYETTSDSAATPRRPETVPDALEILCRSLLKASPDHAFADAYTAAHAKLKEAIGAASPASNFDSVFAEHDLNYHYHAPSPVVLKRLLSSAAPDFNNSQQQDSEEFLQLLFSLYERAHNPLLRELMEVQGTAKMPATGYNKVRLVNFTAPVIELHPSATAETPMRFTDLLAEFTKTKSVKKFPEFLCVAIRRQTLDPQTHQPLKITARIDLASLRSSKNCFTIYGTSFQNAGGLLLEGEQEVSPEEEVPENIVGECVALGFSKGQIVCAFNSLKGTSGSCPTSDAIISYVLDNPDAGVRDGESEDLTILLSMGYSKERAERAIMANPGNLGKAIEQLLAGQHEEQDTPPASSAETSPDAIKYTAIAAVIHLGANVHAGHYIALSYQNGRWWQFNDEVVKPVTDPTQLLEEAYILLFKREK